MRYGEIVSHVNEIFGQYDMPLTLRQIYYRLVADFGMPNRRSAYNTLSRMLVRAREQGEVDDTRIEDRSRETLGGDFGFPGPEEYLKYKIDNFRRVSYQRKMWEFQPRYIEVWVEKDALSRVISAITNKYSVVVCPSRGYSSYTYLKRMAVEDRFQKYTDKPIVVLDFRDHDPSGIQMTEDLQNRLDRYGGDLDITVNRIALTIEQVRRYKLIPNPTKIADPRSPKYHLLYGNECWELDAIEPSELQRIVKESIIDFIDASLWKLTIEQSKREQKDLEKRIAELARKLEV